MAQKFFTNSFGLVHWMETTQAPSRDLRTAVGNLIGGFVFTGSLYVARKPRATAPLATPAKVSAEQA
jgi:hypothetical protein